MLAVNTSSTMTVQAQPLGLHSYIPILLYSNSWNIVHVYDIEDSDIMHCMGSNIVQSSCVHTVHSVH